jgi:glutaredoxin 2
MKLYDGGRAPNPRRVRIFLAEKGITVPTEQVDIGALQQKSDAFTAINPMQRVPALVLDDGTVIAESIAICRYFEALPIRRCSVAVRCNPPWWKCGTVAPSFTCSYRCRIFSGICIRR